MGETAVCTFILMNYMLSCFLRTRSSVEKRPQTVSLTWHLWGQLYSCRQRCFLWGRRILHSGKGWGSRLWSLIHSFSLWTVRGRNTDNLGEREGLMSWGCHSHVPSPWTHLWQVFSTPRLEQRLDCKVGQYIGSVEFICHKNTRAQFGYHVVYKKFT